ncbi:MAG TPA: PilZ domain-containing protein [Nitrospirae bacterium]|nr:PilZ domain-containing protein [Nitrospirota bacterium]
MKQRRFQRTVISSEAELVMDNGNYTGIIANVSEEGIFIILHATPGIDPGFAREKPVKLKFRLPSGEKLILNCKVKWFYKATTHSTLSIGMQITEPPLEYREFLKTLL